MGGPRGGLERARRGAADAAEAISFPVAVMTEARLCAVGRLAIPARPVVLFSAFMEIVGRCRGGWLAGESRERAYARRLTHAPDPVPEVQRCVPVTTRPSSRDGLQRSRVAVYADRLAGREFLAGRPPRVQQQGGARGSSMRRTPGVRTNSASAARLAAISGGRWPVRSVDTRQFAPG